MPASAPDVAGACLSCRTIFLLPYEPAGEGIADGRAPAAICPSCDGLVVALEAATARLADLVDLLRRSGSQHFATVLALAESWVVAPPEPLAALAELSAVAPEVLATVGAIGTPIGARIAVGALLVETLRPLLAVAAGHDDARVGAAAVLDAAAATGMPLSLPA